MVTFREIFRRFLLLGLTAFGGPMAHIALFQRVLVERLRWINAEQFASLLALCQALPGPTSSQVALSVGYRKGGWAGLFAAWLGFSLPPVAILITVALGLFEFTGPARAPLLHGVKVAVVAVVAAAIWKMGHSLVRHRWQLGLAMAATAFYLLFPSPWVILGSLVLAALLVIRQSSPLSPPLPRRPLLSRPLLAAIPLTALAFRFLEQLGPEPWLSLPAVFYQTGLLVFGGGHVVLPLLERLLVEPGLLAADTFLLGYGAAQMVPGPLFSFSAFTGASMAGGPLTGIGLGVLAFTVIYLPSFFLLGLFLPHWDRARLHPLWQEIMAVLHPLVLGLLTATWVHPVLTSGIRSVADGLLAGVAAIALACLARWTLPILAATAATGAVLSTFST